MNLSRQIFELVTKRAQPSVLRNAVSVLNFHSGNVNFNSENVSMAKTTPASEVSVAQVGEPDKLYKLIELEMKANQTATLKSYTTFLGMAAKELGIEIGKCWAPRKPIHHRYTVLRSAFVHKRCRVQYEYRTYFQFMHFHKLTGSTADTFLEYIERNLPEGIALKVTKVAVEKLPQHTESSSNESTNASASQEKS